MGKYIDDSKALLEYVGGKENISAVTHCVTRMRFVLKDTSKADKEKIEALKCVKGTFIQAGQFQVIIGNTVTDFYNDFVKVSGIEGVSKDSVKDAAKSNMSFIQKLMANLAEIFSPLIPAAPTSFPTVELSVPFGLVCENLTEISLALNIAASCNALLYFKGCAPSLALSIFVSLSTSDAIAIGSTGPSKSSS